MLWFKLLTTLFTAGTAYFLYQTGLTLRLSDRDSKLLTALWLSSPLLIFSQFIFGQYDIFTAFFVMAGLYYGLNRRWPKALLRFGLGMTFKYFAFLIFFPFFLLREKWNG